ncbi:MAG: UDP-N-acetylglucosamine 1-carboxyvinyltransferase [Thermacetogeniaceae bacterium]|jgi:UDP-N-acetylglucosamine 1-carboxyvinyltransferase|nr:UDP-N-acetylglucosamine 1-carboxyvinyltransferase [Thermoanaerobacterales bacterium]
MKLVVQGGTPLKGRVRVSGAKNSSLVLIAASAISSGEVILDNVPKIADVKTQLEIVRVLGGQVVWEGKNTLRLKWPGRLNCEIPYSLAKKIRASNLFLGALAAKRGQVKIPLPGGCNIGSRPMDLHLKGLSMLGFDVSLEHGFIEAIPRNVGGCTIYLDFPSVGATENIMMAAAGAPGTTVIENAAKEPEIVDLANFLNAMGGKVRGAGTDLIRVDGTQEFQGTRFSVIPDRIEAGTYMIAAGVSGGEVTVENVIVKHLQPVIAKLQDVGLEVEANEDKITVRRVGELTATDIKTLPYPGFPTDLQSPMMVLLALANGTSVIVENVFENRFQVADELKRMGAKIQVKGHTAVIEGVEHLSGAQVKASDLRAGASLLLAGFAAQGETEISGAELITRGYETVVGKFSNMGAKIKALTEEGDGLGICAGLTGHEEDQDNDQTGCASS